jgi:hypothetical protein
MSTTAKIETPASRVVVGRLQKVRRGTRTLPVEKASKLSGKPEPARVARILALALSIQRAIEAGVIQDQAEAARRLGISRARVTQISDFTLLSPRIQEAVLAMQTVDGAEPIGERTLRDVLRYDSLVLQEAVWAAPCRQG